MQYLLLIYENESAGAARSPEEQKTMMKEYFAFNEVAKAGGNYIGGEPLEPVATATTVRVRDGEVLHTDGPFAETKEQLGGYYLVEASDLDRALELARQIPAARVGCVEVRPVMVLPDLDSM